MSVKNNESTPKIIAVVTMIKNEADIIESMVRHALSYADILLAAEHQSTDDTRKILESMVAEGLPIKLYDCHEVGHAQKEVMNDLLYKAFQDEGADIVIPADADEFLLTADGNSRHLRELLEALPLNASYTVPMVNFTLVNEDQDCDKFLLSRPAFRAKSACDIGKCIVGREIAEETNGKLVQGNHAFFVEGTGDGIGLRGYQQQEELPSSIYIAHFPLRGQGQRALKNISMWLTNLVRYGKYSYFVRNYQANTYNYLTGNKILDEYEPSDMTEADLSNYAVECTLKYTKGTVEPMKNIVHLAEIIAADCAKESVLSQRRLVSTIILYTGDLKLFINSMQSVLQQSYPYQEIFIAVTANKNVEQLVEYVKKINAPARICLQHPFAYIGTNARGHFVQIVECGDILQREKTQNQVIFLEKHDIMTFAMSRRVNNRKQAEERDICEIKKPVASSFKNLLEDCLINGTSIMLGGISGAMFRRKDLDDMKWIDPYLCQGMLPMHFWLHILKKSDLEVFGSGVLFEEAMVQKQNHAISVTELAEDLGEWQNFVRKYSDTDYLSVEGAAKAQLNIDRTYNKYRDILRKQFLDDNEFFQIMKVIDTAMDKR